ATRMPPAETGDVGLSLLAPGGKPTALAGAVRQLGRDDLTVTVADGVLALSRGPVATNTFEGSRQFYQSQFQAAAGGKGFVEKKDLRGDQGPFLQTLFPFADRDGDGKLTQKELQAWLVLQTQGAA